MNSANLSPSVTFCGGEGFSDNYINCSANRYDLRPAADIIVGAAHKMRDELPEDTPLVILMGELHSMPSHIMLQQMVASRLLDQGDHFTFNFELPYNWGAKKALGLFASRKRVSDCAGFDPKGEVCLSAFMGRDKTITTPVSCHNIMAFCYDKGLATVFNDAVTAGDCLDMKDPVTVAMVKVYEKGATSGNKIKVTNPAGMATRNLMMAERGLAYAKKNNANLLMQATGNAHVFGWKQENFGYEESLCAAYRNAGAAVLPVFVSSREGDFGLNVLPEEAYRELPGSVIIDGLADDRFFGWSAGEKEFTTEKLHKNSGNELAFYDVAADKGRYKRLARKHAAEMVRAYEEANPSWLSRMKQRFSPG